MARQRKQCVRICVGEKTGSGKAIRDCRRAECQLSQKTKQPVPLNGVDGERLDVASKKVKEARPGLEPGNNGFAIRPLSHLGTAPVGSKLRRSGFSSQEE
jgi:hypothetical protein